MRCWLLSWAIWRWPWVWPAGLGAVGRQVWTAGLLLAWGRQGWGGLRASLTPTLAWAGLLCVAGVVLAVDNSSQAVSAEAGSGGWLPGVAAALLGLMSASVHSGAVLFAGSGDRDGWQWGRSDFWHIGASICGVVSALLAGVFVFGLGSLAQGWLLLAFWHGGVTRITLAAMERAKS